MVCNHDDKEECSEQKDDSSNTNDKVPKQNPSTPVPLPSKASPVPKPRLRPRRGKIVKERDDKKLDIFDEEDDEAAVKDASVVSSN